MRHALLRYLEADSLQRVLTLAEEKNWDTWPPAEIVRFLTFMFCVAGGAAPALVIGNVVEKLFEDPKLVTVYKANRKKFLLEMIRLQRGVPFINFIAHDFELPDGQRFVTMFNKKIAVPNGVSLHCSVELANRDGKSDDNHLSSAWSFRLK
jgi:hypothetical protein